MAVRIEDTTGKFIEVVGEATEILKGLVNSLKGTVGTATAQRPAESDLKDIAKSSEDAADKIIDAINNLPEKIAEEVAKELNYEETHKFIEEIRDGIDDINKRKDQVKKKSSGLNSMEQMGASLKGKGIDKHSSAMEKAMGVLSKQGKDDLNVSKTEMRLTRSMFNMFNKKGSGYTHDIHVEAILREMLSLVKRGAARSRRRSGGGGGEPPDAGGTMTPIGPLPEDLPGNEDHLDGMSRANQMMESMLGGINRMRRGARYWQSDFYHIAETGAEISAEIRRQNAGVEEGSAKHERIIQQEERRARIVRDVGQIIDQLSTHDKLRLKNMVREIQAMKDQLRTMKQQGASQEQMFELTKQLNEKYDQLANASDRIYKKHHLLWGAVSGIGQILKNMAASVSSIMSGFAGSRYLMGVFDHMQESMEQTVRQTGLMRSLMADRAWAGPSDYFNKMMHVSVAMVDQMGQAPHIIRKSWLTAIKKGTRGIEDMKDSISNSLSLATAIGSSAESTADEFRQWNMEVGLSNRQTAVLARNIKQTAASLGVMGDEMLKAVSSARELAQAVRDAGFQAEGVAEQMIRITAAGQKFGVSKQLEEINRTMAGGLDSYISASQEMRNLLAQAGQTQAVISGQAASDPEAMKGATTAIGDMLKEEFRRAGALNKEGKVDTSKLTPQQISQMNLIFRKRFGKNMGVGESARLVEAIEDANMTTDQKMERIRRNLSQNTNLTDAERKASEAQLKILEEQKKAEKATALVNALDRMNQAMKEGSPAEAMAAMQKTLDAEARNAASRGIAMSTDISTAVRDSIGSVNDRLKKAGQKQLATDTLMQRFEAARASNNVAAMREVMSEISSGNQLADTQMKKQSNLLDKSEQSQLRWQARIQDGLAKTVQFLGFLPVAVIWLTAIAATLLGAMSIWRLISIYGQKTMHGVSGLLFHGTKAGSLFTRDIRTYFMLKNIYSLLRAQHMQARRQAGIAKTIRKDDTLSAMHAKGGKSALTAEKSAAKQWKYEQARLGHDRKELAWEKRTFNQRKKMLEVQRKSVLSKAAKSGGPAKAGVLQIPSFDVKGMASAGRNMVQGAVGLALLAAGIVALAVIIFKISQMIVKATGLDFKTALEVAGTITVVLLAAGMIAAAAIGSAQALKWLRATIGWKDYGTIAHGALFLAALTPLIMLLAVAIIGMGRLLSKIVDLSTAAKTATAVAAILTAAGVIAVAVLASAWALKLLGAWLSKGSWLGYAYMAYFMTLGAIAIILLTPVLLLLAGAIIGLSQAMGANLENLAEAATTAGIVAGIIASAGVIAVAVLGSAWALKILGAFIWGLGLTGIAIMAGLMLLGGIALMILTPAMIMLARGIIDLAAGVAGDATDLKQAATTAGIVAGILASAAVISVAVMASAWALQLLGAWLWALGWKGILIMAGLMFLGGLALRLLTPAMISLAAGIVEIAESSIAGIDLGHAKKVAEDVGNLIKAATSILGSILKMASLGALLSLMIILGPIMWILVQIALPGLRAAKNACVDLIRELMDMGEEMSNAVDKGKVEKTKAAMEDVSSIITSVTKVLDGVAKAIIPLVTRPFLGILGDTIAEKLESGVKTVSNLLEKVGQFITDGIVEAMVHNTPEEGKLQEATKKMDMMGGMLEKLKPILDFMTKTVIKLNEKSGWFGWWGKTQAEKIEDAIETVAEVIGMTAEFLNEGVVEAVRSGGSVQGYEEARKNLESMGTMCDKLKPVLDFMTGTVVKLNEGSGWFGAGKTPAEKAKAAKDIVIDLIKDTANFMNDGIVTTVSNQQLNGDYEGAGKKLEQMGNVINKLKPILDFMTGTVVKITSGGWFSSSPAKKIKKAMPQAKTLINNTFDFIQEIASDVNSTAKVSGFDTIVDRLLKMGEAIQKLKPILDFMTGTIIYLTDRKGGGVFSKGVSVADKIAEIKNDAKTLIENTIWFIKEGVVKPMSDAQLGDIDGATARMEDIATIIEKITPILNFMSGKVLELGRAHWWTGKTLTEEIKAATPKVKGLISDTIDFVNQGIVDTMEKKAIGDYTGAAAKLEAIGTMIDRLKPILDFMTGTMLRLTQPTGWFKDGPSIKDRLTGQKDNIKQLISNTIDFVNTSVVDGVSSGMKNGNKTRDYAQATEVLSQIGTMLEKLKPILDFMTGTILRLTESRSFLFFISKGKSYAKRIEEAKKPAEDLIKHTFSFLNEGIVDVVKAGGWRDYEDSARILVQIGTIIEKLTPILNFMTDTILRLTKSPWWSGVPSTAQQIEDAIPTAETLISNVFQFLNSGLVDTINNKGRGKNYEGAAKKLELIADIIQKFHPILEFMEGTVLRLVEGKALKNGSSIAEKIDAAIEVVRPLIANIARFLSLGVVETINKTLPNEKGFELAANKLSLMANIIQSLTPILDFMENTVVRLVEAAPKEKTPAKKIMAARGPVADLIEASAIFIRDSIVKVINDNVSKEGEKAMEQAATKLYKMAEVINYLRPILEFMTGTVVDLNKMDTSTMQTAVQAVENAAPEVARMIRVTSDFLVNDVVNEINKVMYDTKAMEDAVVKLQKVGEVVQAVRPVMDFMIQMVGNLGEGDIKKAPASKAVELYGLMYNFFWATAKLMRFAVIDPVNLLIPKPEEMDEVNAKLVKLAEVIQKTSIVVSTLTKVLFYFMLLKNWEKLVGNITSKTQDFADFFVGVGVVLKTGLIDPITKDLPDTKQLEDAIRRLELTQKLVWETYKTLWLVAAVLFMMMWGWWWKWSFTSLVPTFIDYFANISDTLKRGIIEPIIKYFPTVETLQDAIGRLEGMANVVKKSYETIYSLPEELDNLQEAMESVWVGQGDRVGFFANYFGGIGNVLYDGIIDPIHALIPKSDEIDSATTIITSLTESISGLSFALLMLADAAASMPKNIDLSELSNIGIKLKAQSEGGFVSTGEGKEDTEIILTKMLGALNEISNISIKLKAQSEGGFVSTGEGKEDTEIILTKMLGALTGIRAPQMSQVGGLANTINRGMGTSVGEPVKKGMKDVGTEMEDVGSGINKVSKSLGEVGGNITGALAGLQMIVAINNVATAVTNMKVEMMRNDDANTNKIINALKPQAPPQTPPPKPKPKPMPPPDGGPPSYPMHSMGSRDADVYAHEMMHSRVAGKWGSKPHYQYATGPDGKKYRMGGYVNVNTSKAGSPLKTLAKMAQIRAAALAPSLLGGEAGILSESDLSVAAYASQTMRDMVEDIFNKKKAEVKAVVDNKGKMNAGAMSDLEERVQQRIQSGKPPAATAAVNEEIAKIRANTDQLVNLAMEQVDLLNDIVEMSKETEANTLEHSSSKPKKRSRYFTWGQARYGDSAAKQYM